MSIATYFDFIHNGQSVEYYGVCVYPFKLSVGDYVFFDPEHTADVIPVHHGVDEADLQELRHLLDEGDITYSGKVTRVAVSAPFSAGQISQHVTIECEKKED